MELFGELQAALMGFAQGSDWTGSGKLRARSWLHLWRDVLWSLNCHQHFGKKKV